jgi:DNA-binding transcriptional MerR regulator
VTDTLLSIGRFARLTGLSIGALRHYDELGLLAPAEIDPVTGYRRYRERQLDRARTIRRLREIEASLDEVERVLAADDPVERAAVLRAVRGRIEARAWQLHYAIHVLNQLIGEKENLVPTEAPDLALTPQQHRRLGADLFNFVWTLIEKVDRTPEEIDTMIHAAHASRHHWRLAAPAGPEHLARGEWQCSRVYAVLERAEPARWHARRCLEICEANGIADWDIAFAYEALARAARVAGDRAEVERWLERARTAGESIAEAEDRELLLADLATI